MADRGAAPDPTTPSRSLDLQTMVRTAVGVSESGLYLVVGVLLFATALLVVIAATTDLVHGIQRNEDLIEVGLRSRLCSLG